MRKVILATIISLVAMAGFSSCSDDDDEAPLLGALVDVTVKDILGNPYKGGTVYMFKNVDPNEETDKGSADKTEKTNDDGLAKFNLNLTDLNITESKTPLFFAVYYTGEYLAGLNIYPAKERDYYGMYHSPFRVVWIIIIN